MTLTVTLIQASANRNAGLEIFLVMAIVAFGVGFSLWAIQRTITRRRTEGMKTAAQEIGFTFEGDEWTDPRPGLFLATALFGKGHTVEFKNIMSGSRDGMKTRIFDYKLRIGTGTGRNSHAEAQTVGAFSKDGVYLPYFEMRPNKPFDWVVDAVTHKNIHFESNPEFAKHCYLQSPLENDMRSLFTPALLTYLEQLNAQKKWSIEGAGNTLIIFQSRKRSAPAALRTFLDETSSIADSFFSLGNCPPGTSKNYEGI
jgi:hypothetical protein